MLLQIAIILVAAGAIWIFSHMLSMGTDAIGTHYRIRPSVRGATLDAVASSFPEFCTVIFALSAGAFDAGVGTIAGSALYNILVIPAMSVLVGGPLKIDKQVVRRDGFLYVAVVVGLLIAIWLGPSKRGGAAHELTQLEGLFALAIYFAYITVLVLQARPGGGSAGEPRSEPPAEESDTGKQLSPLRVGAYVLFGISGIGVATHYLVDSSIALFRHIGLSEAIAGVTVLAAATSLPDTLLSVFAVKRGDADGAVSNAFGSNSFDILICLGLPVLVSGGAMVDWEESRAILIFLFVSTVVSVVFLITDWTLTRLEAAIMGLLYVLFVVLAFAKVL